LIKYFQGISLIDFPDVISSIIFIGGCNFRCPFCHNPELVLPEKLKEIPDISEEMVLKELKKTKGFVRGVEFTGGEPLLHPFLRKLMEKIKDMGFLIKLDSNGSLPERLEKVIDIVDYIAMDVKTSFKKYRLATSVDVDISTIKESIEIVMSANNYEFRTTVVPSVVTKEDIMEIAEEIEGARRYVLQNFRNIKTLNPDMEKVKPYPSSYINEIKNMVDGKVEIVEIRNT